MHGIRALIRGPRVFPSLPPCEAAVVTWLSRKQAFTRHQICQHLDLMLLRLQNCVKQMFTVYKPLMVFCYSSPNELKHYLFNPRKWPALPLISCPCCSLHPNYPAYSMSSGDHLCTLRWKQMLPPPCWEALTTVYYDDFFICLIPSLDWELLWGMVTSCVEYQCPFLLRWLISACLGDELYFLFFLQISPQWNAILCRQNGASLKLYIEL